MHELLTIGYNIMMFICVLCLLCVAALAAPIVPWMSLMYTTVAIGGIYLIVTNQ